MAVDTLTFEDLPEYTAEGFTDDEADDVEDVSTEEEIKTAREDFELINEYPNLVSGYRVDDGQIEIFERIGFNDRVGPTYLAMAANGKELVLRIGKPDASIARLEAAFLCKAEAEHMWAQFSQVHSVWQQDGFYFLALYFRGGPTLQQCFEFSKYRFTHGTAGRLGLDSFKILRAVHKMEYIVRRLELDMFHLDAASRHLFLADISSIMKDMNKSTIEAQRNIGISWIGCPLFAPIAHHLGQNITERDVLEAWAYMLIFMTTGTLPWHGVALDDIQWLKIKSINEGELFIGLPMEYKEIFEKIARPDSSSPISLEEYEDVEALLTQIYTKYGGVTDEDDNFDFERDPTEDELPRFVLERDDAVPAEEVQENASENH